MIEDTRKQAGWFERKLTLDGVTIIIALLGAFVWGGHLQEKVDTMREEQMAQSVKMDSLSTSIDGVKNDVSVLRAVLDERTGKPSSH